MKSLIHHSSNFVAPRQPLSAGFCALNPAQNAARRVADGGVSCVGKLLRASARLRTRLILGVEFVRIESMGGWWTPCGTNLGAAPGVSATGVKTSCAYERARHQNFKPMTITVSRPRRPHRAATGARRRHNSATLCGHRCAKVPSREPVCGKQGVFISSGPASKWTAGRAMTRGPLSRQTLLSSRRRGQTD